MKRLVLYFILFLSIVSCESEPTEGFVKTNSRYFQINNKPYYYIGTNYWYGPIIASESKWGNRERLLKELDFMKKIGINNLRILIGAEGPDGEPFRITPALQVAPGEYNELLLDGLDFLMAEMKKREQYAILYFQNSWDWSGGYAQYLNWHGYGEIPYPMVEPNTWDDFKKYSKQFHACEPCKEQFRNYIKFIMGRVNKYTGLKYTEDPVIMTWEIGNEPRAFGKDNIPLFEEWIRETAALIKSLDTNHLVTTGTEGQHGCMQSIELFEKIHADPNIDYLTMHIWPKNWSWLNIKDIAGTIDISIEKTNKYMKRHFEIARKLNKPIVLEEFGLPRDYHGYSANETTIYRDKYYQNAFSQIVEHAKTKDVLSGCNFWTFGGMAKPVQGQTYWKIGDPYLGDPPCEEQGLNSVYDTDSAITLISEFNQKINNALKH